MCSVHDGGSTNPAREGERRSERRSNYIACVPTYEFRCPNGHEFERFYKTISGADSSLTCPECGAVAARQLSGGAGLLFKGSGFYLTDYGKNAHRKPGPDTKSDKGGESKSESKSETAAPKTESKSDKGTPKPDKAAPAPKPKPKAE